jgi:hypothetical protein
MDHDGGHGGEPANWADWQTGGDRLCAALGVQPNASFVIGHALVVDGGATA